MSIWIRISNQNICREGSTQSLQLSFSGIATEMSVWDGVVVTPQDRAYVKPDKNKDGNEETDMEIVKS